MMGRAEKREDEARSDESSYSRRADSKSRGNSRSQRSDQYDDHRTVRSRHRDEAAPKRRWDCFRFMVQVYRNLQLCLLQRAQFLSSQILQAW